MSAARRAGWGWFAGGLPLACGLLGARCWFLHCRERFPLRGIDVSHHQGDIDWRRVARDDVAFVYLKATEGGDHRDHRDRRFARNWQAARAAGLKVGAYHFFTLCRSGEAQARNFLAVVPRAADALPPDWIWNSVAIAGPDRRALQCVRTSMPSSAPSKRTTVSRRCYT